MVCFVMVNNVCVISSTFLLTSCDHMFLSNTGDKWDKERHRNWKTDKNVCDWAGISCNDTGEIIGLSFPPEGSPHSTKRPI